MSTQPHCTNDPSVNATASWFQAEIEGLVDPALLALEDLCERADSEAVRLKAAVQIMSFAGMRPARRRWLRSGSSLEMAEARRELEAIMMQLIEATPELMRQAATQLSGASANE